MRYLFEASTAIYERSPETVRLVPPELYERGRRLAERLVGGTGPVAVLHGDLTPRNVLDGGPGRGLVAIDPAPCLGDDPTFWCAASAAMVALELAESPDRPEGRFAALLALAGTATA